MGIYCEECGSSSYDHETFKCLLCGSREREAKLEEALKVAERRLKRVTTGRDEWSKDVAKRALAKIKEIRDGE
jgi:ribosomal protein L37E